MILLSFTSNFKLLLTDLVLNRREKNISSQTHFYRPSSPHCDGGSHWFLIVSMTSSQLRLTSKGFKYLSFIKFWVSSSDWGLWFWRQTPRNNYWSVVPSGMFLGKLWNGRENIRAGQQLWCYPPWCRSWCGVLLPQWQQVGGGCGAGNKLMAMS